MTKKKILFLHGFMGSASEHDFLASFKQTYDIKALNLPDGSLNSLNDLFDEIDSIKPNYIYGYSLGGRVALHYLSQRKALCEKLFLESVSFGIKENSDRLARLNLDRSRGEHIMKDFKSFLNSWYHQNLWGEISQDQLAELIHNRFTFWNNNTRKLSEMIVNYSPGNMPFISRDQIESHIVYIHGMQDIKYTQIANQLNNVNLISIKDVGHNVHHFAKDELIKKLQKYL